MALKTHETLYLNRTGFTLVEIIVSISIAMIIMGSVIVNYNEYNNRQTLKQAALTLKNNLRFAQSKAQSGEKPESNCTELTGWTVTFVGSGYAYQAQCIPQGLHANSTSVTLPSGVIFSPVPAAFTFNVLSRGTSLANTRALMLAGFNKTYRLEVSPGGDISDEGY